jgi:hypothetical protein
MCNAIKPKRAWKKAPFVGVIRKHFLVAAAANRSQQLAVGAIFRKFEPSMIKSKGLTSGRRRERLRDIRCFMLGFACISLCSFTARSRMKQRLCQRCSKKLFDHRDTAAT